MQGSEILLELAGAVALLVWATRMVRTGVERAYGVRLKTALSRAFCNRLMAAFGGMVLAMVLQSSTAVVLMASGFVAAGYLAALPAVAAAVGADLGSALLAVILRADLSVLAPILLVLGLVVFRGTDRPLWAHWGRILFGLGLLLLSLRLIGTAAAPLRDGAAVPTILSLATGDPLLLFLIAALAAWLFHSTLATVLLAALLADQGVLASGLIGPVVLGINFGGGLMGAALARSLPRQGRVVPHANLVLRALWSAGGLAALMAWPLPDLGLGHGTTVVAAHVAVNVGILVTGLILAGPLCRLLLSLAKGSGENAIDRLSALDPADLATPAQALRNAGREAVALCGVIEGMIARLPTLIREGAEPDFVALAQADRTVDRRFAQIRDYLCSVAATPDDPALTAERTRLLRVVVRLEQVGDLVAQRVATRAAKRRDRAAAFSEEGWAELAAVLEELRTTVRLAANLVASGDVDLARRLVGQKATVRIIERQSSECHFERLREGRLDTLSSSTVHLDVLYDLKEINSLLVEIGYPVLEQEGQLRPDRLNLVDQRATGQ
jgi:phosphate:Na+ symporter